jgi:hypothetical protein
LIGLQRRAKYMLKPACRLCVLGLLAIAAALAQQTPPDPATIMGALDKQMGPLASTWLHSADPRIKA